MEQLKRTLTVIEGREENRRVISDFKKVADSRGWLFKNLNSINSDKLARFDLKDIPLDYVVFRDLSLNNYAETERLLDYLKINQKVVINANPSGARSATSDKHYQQGLFLLDSVLKQYALPTFEAKSKENVMSYINGRRVHFPIVLKYRYGTAGKNIKLIHNETELNAVKNFKNFLIEQYIEAECDWRVFVIGGTAVGVMRKVGDLNNPENFILWSAGRTKSREENLETIELLGKIACRAAAVSRLEYTGVDIIQDKNTKKFYILETNFAAGWINGFPEATGVNIPDLVLDWLEERGDAKNQSIKKSIQHYLKTRKQYLSSSTIQQYEAILNGEKRIVKKLKERFKEYPANYLYDTGSIFKKLSNAYEDLTESSHPADYKSLIKEIESMPLSWAGNYIGPNLGTLEDGAILSALYLFLLGKSKEV